MTIRRILFWFLTAATVGLFATSAVVAIANTVVAIANTIERFSTPDEAAVFVLDAITERNFEMAGAIIQDEHGLYYYTLPQGTKDTEGFSIRVLYPKGHKIVGIYHTHPDQTSHQISGDLFSPEDIELSNAMRVPSYIKVLSNGAVRKYEPGVSRTQRYKAPGRGAPKGRVSEGHVLIAGGPLS